MINSKIENAIVIKNLSIVLNEQAKKMCLLSSINYEFKKNKIYYIVGDSGCGKTILVNHFNGLLKSSHGDIFVDNIPILGKTKKIKQIKKLRKIISIVFQFPEYQLFKNTVEEDIMFGPLNFGVKFYEAKQNAKFYLNMLGLNDEFLKMNPFHLSDGQKRRVAIAGILAINPDILIFDEPTVGLDPLGEKKIIEIIKNLKKQGKTIIVISHSMDNALELADEILLIKNKKLFFAGQPYEFFTNNSFLSNTNIIKPKIIALIDKLVEANKKFKILYKLKPKTISELALAINNLGK